MDKSKYFIDGVFQPVHQHVIVKAHSTQPITDETLGKQFLVDLVNIIDMVPVTEPQAVNVRSLGSEGLTGSINLCTSHVAYHCWELTGLLMLDVYSCTCFDVLDMVEFLRETWKLDKISYSIIDRNNEEIYDFGIRGLD